MIYVEFAPAVVREREALMKINERPLGRIEEHLRRIEDALQQKANLEDVEFASDELTFKLEEIHSDVIEIKDGLEVVNDCVDIEGKYNPLAFRLDEIQSELQELKGDLKGELADVKSQMNDLKNADWP